nr:uncharacterized protein LOC115265680 [Aedes albopictus]
MIQPEKSIQIVSTVVNSGINFAMPNAHALSRPIGRSPSDEGVLSFYDHMSRIVSLVSRFAITLSEQNKKKNEHQTAKPSGIYRFIKNFISIISETATCDTIKCKDRQQCLTDLQTHKPRCVSCSYKCPRVKRPQQTRKLGNGGNGGNHHHQQQQHRQSQQHHQPANVKLCGTNNHTYHSWCHMLRDSCNTGFYIDVQYNGVCSFDRSAVSSTILTHSTGGGKNKP